MRRRLPAFQIILLLVAASLPACAARQLESAKTLYTRARSLQQQGDDTSAVLYWKRVVVACNEALAKDQFVQSNYFLRASAYVELGEWESAFRDLKQIRPEELRKEEYWIYPLYALLLGDYYSNQHMHTAAESFYQSVLGESSLRSSPVYLLALERHINSSVKAIELAAAKQTDSQKFRAKAFEDLAKEAEKHLEDNPFSAMAHYLVADLAAKTGRTEKALEHMLVAFELGLPTTDLRRSAEYQFATLLSARQIDAPFKSTLLTKAVQLWGKGDPVSMLRAGESTFEWIVEHGARIGAEPMKGAMIRYVAVERDGTLNVLAWEKR